MSGHPDRRNAPLRLGADAEDVGRGLGQLVVAVLEIVRELLERRALRRVDSGDLDETQIERLGRALQELEEKLAELREVFGVEPEDLRLPANLGELLADERADPRWKEEATP
ncbi:MAG: gas vesicle protein K [Pseudonocardiaceae bacterium]|nr:gas vesicle protein K [Pseudonocardiaceae bacterium]